MTTAINKTNMTRQKLPDICNFCGKSITSETQYVLELTQGRSTMPQIRIRANSYLDMCHPCFMEVAKNGYEPQFIKEQRNPQYRPGSKLASEKYYIPIDDSPKQEVLAK